MLNQDKRTILVIGGASSGKSSYALSLSSGKKLFVATSVVTDGEMEKKVEKHKRERGGEWDLVEEPVMVPETLTSIEESYDTVVVDSITAFVSNLLMEGVEDNGILDRVKRLFNAVCRISSISIFVSDEVGMGVVPDYPLGRRFRNIIGICNRFLSSACSEVYFLLSGIPLRLK